MREVDIHEVFERFRSGAPLAIPAGADAARRAGNRRRRIRIAATTAAAVVAIAAPAVAYAVVPRDSPPDVASSPTPTVPTPSTTVPTQSTTTPTPKPDVEPTDRPVAMALQQSDVPTGYEYRGSQIDGDWTVEFSAQLCAPPHNLHGLPSASATWDAAFETGSPEESRVIFQRIARYTVAEAQAYVEAVRDMARGCVQVGGDPITWTIAQEGFAGDDALLLKLQGAGVDNTYVVVRVGELVTQIWYRDTDTPDPVLLGQRAAARLCEGTTTC